MLLDLTHRIDLVFVKIGSKLLFSYDFYGWIGQLDLFYPKSQFHTFSGSLQILEDHQHSVGLGAFIQFKELHQFLFLQDLYFHRPGKTQLQYACCTRIIFVF